MSRASASARLCATVQRVLDETGLSHRDLADLLGWSRSAVSMLVSGQRAKAFDKLDDLAQALGCSIGDLFDEQPKAKRKGRAA